MGVGAGVGKVVGWLVGEGVGMGVGEGEGATEFGAQVWSVWGELQPVVQWKPAVQPQIQTLCMKPWGIL